MTELWKSAGSKFMSASCGLQSLPLTCKVHRASYCTPATGLSQPMGLRASSSAQTRSFSPVGCPRFPTISAVACHSFFPAGQPVSSSRRSISASAAASVAETAPRLAGYDASQIQVLEGLDPVRRRPGMYIGSTGQRGLHHLVYEILDNSIDEVQAGHATNIKVSINPVDGWVEITDDGRGIPTDMHLSTGKSALETVLTVLHAGGKFGGGNSGYKISGGLHGVGISVVNALSSQLQATVYKKGRTFTQNFERGVATSGLVEADAAADDPQHGTTIRFLYDREIFAQGVSFDTEIIRTRLRETAFLNSSATITFVSGGQGKQGGDSDSNGTASGKAVSVSDSVETFHFSGGISEFVQWNNRSRTPMHDPIFISQTVNGVQVEIALQWTSDSFSDSMVGFVNSIKTIDGGTHMEGLKASLTRTVNTLGRKLKLLKDDLPNLSGDHVREGLGAIISVKVPDPEFEGQTKTRLGNPEVRKIVEGIVSKYVASELELDQQALSSIVAKAMQALRAAEAAKKARELVRRKTVLTKSTLPGKLSDCTTTDMTQSEIFLVEGDSAGGSAKMARDRKFQAILPLRGKILNVERADDQKVYANEEISNLIIGLGLGVKGDSLKGLRYGKVIILTDADVDGAHIRTLLLTFLFRYSRELFEGGYVYVGVPPLYKVTTGRGKSTYCYDDTELTAATAKLTPGSYSLQRFKGLGEMMPEQLWKTTMDPARRTLKRLTIGDAAAAAAAFSLLMGPLVAPRREFIESNAQSIGKLDV